MASMSDVNVIDVGHPQGLPEFDLIWSQDAGVVDLQERGQDHAGKAMVRSLCWLHKGPLTFIRC